MLNPHRQPGQPTDRLTDPELHYYPQPDLNPVLDHRIDAMRNRIRHESFHDLSSAPDDATREQRIRELFSRLKTFDLIYENPEETEVLRFHAAGMISDQERDEFVGYIAQADSHGISLNHAPRTLPSPPLQLAFEQLEDRLLNTLSNDIRDNAGNSARQSRALQWTMQHYKILQRIERGPNPQMVARLQGTGRDPLASLVTDIYAWTDGSGAPLLDSFEFPVLINAIRGHSAGSPTQAWQPGPHLDTYRDQEEVANFVNRYILNITEDAPQNSGAPTQRAGVRDFFRTLFKRPSPPQQPIFDHTPEVQTEVERFLNARDAMYDHLRQMREAQRSIDQLGAPDGQMSQRAQHFDRRRDAQKNLDDATRDYELARTDFNEQLKALNAELLTQRVDTESQGLAASLSADELVRERARLAGELIPRLMYATSQIMEDVTIESNRQFASARHQEGERTPIWRQVLSRYAKLHPALRIGISAAIATGVAVTSAAFFPALFPAAAAAIAKMGGGYLFGLNAARLSTSAGLAGLFGLWNEDRRKKTRSTVITQAEQELAQDIDTARAAQPVAQQERWLETPEGRHAALEAMARISNGAVNDLLEVDKKFQGRGRIATIGIGIATGFGFSMGGAVEAILQGKGQWSDLIPFKHPEEPPAPPHAPSTGVGAATGIGGAGIPGVAPASPDIPSTPAASAAISVKEPSGVPTGGQPLQNNLGQPALKVPDAPPQALPATLKGVGVADLPQKFHSLEAPKEIAAQAKDIIKHMPPEKVYTVGHWSKADPESTWQIVHTKLGLTPEQANYVMEHDVAFDKKTGTYVSFKKLSLIQPGMKFGVFMDENGKPHVVFSPDKARGHWGTLSHHDPPTHAPPEGRPLKVSVTGTGGGSGRHIPLDEGSLIRQWDDSLVSLDSSGNSVASVGTPGATGDSVMEIEYESIVNREVILGTKEVTVKNLIDFADDKTEGIDHDVMEKLSELSKKYPKDFSNQVADIKNQIEQGKTFADDELVKTFESKE